MIALSFSQRIAIPYCRTLRTTSLRSLTPIIWPWRFHTSIVIVLRGTIFRQAVERREHCCWTPWRFCNCLVWKYSIGIRFIKRQSVHPELLRSSLHAIQKRPTGTNVQHPAAHRDKISLCRSPPCPPFPTCRHFFWSIFVLFALPLAPPLVVVVFISSRTKPFGGRSWSSTQR